MQLAAALAALALVHGTPHADRLATDDGRPQRVVCGAGDDLVTADGADRVAADCETVVRRIFADPLRAAGAQHATVVEPDSAASDATVVAAFQVGRNLPFGGAAAIGFATSGDAGRTWRGGLLPGLVGGDASFVSDPAVVYDAVHRTWLVAALFQQLGVGNGIDVARSPDGLSWQQPVTAASAAIASLAFDKEWLACDASLGSAFRGRCYLAYTDTLANALAVVHSDDGGLTWSAPVLATAAAEEEELTGAQPAVLPDGTVAVVYVDGGSIRSVVSRDGGASFAAAVDVATATPASVPLRPGLALPSVEAGGDGRVHAAWVDATARGVNEVVVASSADGESWTPPARVRAVPDGDAFLPALAADPASRRLALTAYRVANFHVDAYTVVSRDAGATWSTPRRLSARSLQLSWLAHASAPFLGDYMSTEFAGARVVPVLVLAAPPARGLLREAAYAASLSP